MAANAFVMWVKPSRVDKLDRALADDQLMVGWSEVQGLLDNTLSKNDIRDLVHDVYHRDEPTKHKAGSAATHLWHFLRQMSEGDLVLVPRGESFYLARINDSHPEYHEELNADDTAYRRNVEWLNDRKPFSRLDLSESLQSRLKSVRSTSAEITEFLGELERLSLRKNETSPWKDQEIEAIVLNYRDMLQKELAELPYNKTEHRNLLMTLINRGKGAIEFKHQNISAVLEQMGRPWILGYKPLHNFQGSLVDAVERLILPVPNAGWPKEKIPDVGDVNEIFVKEQTIRSNAKQPGFRTERVARKIDYAARDSRNRELGRAGEEFVFKVEQRKLSHLPDLASRVLWASKIKGDGLGYDIETFDSSGKRIFIEVKTTKGSADTPFYISAEEMAAANYLGAGYRLYRVFSFGQKTKILEVKSPIALQFNFEASVYKAELR